MTQITLQTGPECRRHWSAAAQREILSAAFMPGAVVTEVARRYDVSTSLIYKWRQQARSRSDVAFVPAVLLPEPVTAPASSDKPGDCGRAYRRDAADDRCASLDGFSGGGAEGVAMIPVASNVRIWIASGHTDMRKGMQGLALLVQEGLKRDPFAGDVFVFRGRGGSLIKALWHDGIGLSLYAKRLDRGRFVWPQTVDGAVALTAGQMGYLLEAIDWRNPQQSFRPGAAG